MNKHDASYRLLFRNPAIVRSLHDVEELIQKVYNYTKADPIVRRAFASWTRHVLLPRSLPDVDMPQIDNLLEIKNMLAEHSRSWTHQWKMEGLAEGRKEGREQGIQEGRKEGRKEGRVSAGVILTH